MAVNRIASASFTALSLKIIRVYYFQQKDERPDPSMLPPLPLPFRDRGHTISVMSPVKKSRAEWDNIRRGNSPRVKDPPKAGINPR